MPPAHRTHSKFRPAAIRRPLTPCVKSSAKAASRSIASNANALAWGVKSVYVAGKPPVVQRHVDFDFARVEKLMGVKIADADIRRTLEALGFGLSPAAGGQPKRH